jgi:ubiquinone/menaquinone biosynthesis C-methylase UbiE
MVQKALVEQQVYIRQEKRIKGEIEQNIIPEQTKFNSLASMLPTSFENKVILDIGSGGGAIAVQVAQSNCEYIAVDISSVAAKLTASFTRQLGISEKLHSIVADAHRLPIKSDSVDIVVVIDVLEHVVGPQRVLLETEKVLKDKGYLYVTVPYAFGVETMLLDDVVRLAYALRIRKRIPIHLWSFTEYRIKAMLCATGFQPSECAYYPASYFLFIMRRFIPKGLETSMERSIFRKSIIALYGQVIKNQ